MRSCPLAVERAGSWFGLPQKVYFVLAVVFGKATMPAEAGAAMPASSERATTAEAMVFMMIS